MSPPIAIALLLLAAAVVWVISAPVRAANTRSHAGARSQPDAAQSEAAEKQDAVSVGETQNLEAAREAKYREIRDAEMDYRTGKLSKDDYDAIDATLRAEALTILDELERGGGEREPRSDALEQQNGVQEEQDRKEDRPAV